MAIFINFVATYMYVSKHYFLIKNTCIYTFQFISLTHLIVSYVLWFLLIIIGGGGGVRFLVISFIYLYWIYCFNAVCCLFGLYFSELFIQIGILTLSCNSLVKKRVNIIMIGQLNHHFSPDNGLCCSQDLVQYISKGLNYWMLFKCCLVNKRYRILKGQYKIDNPEKLTT